MSTDLAVMPSPSREVGRRPMSRLIDITQSLDGIWNLATLLLESSLLPREVNTPQKAVAIILKGDELGIAPMLALEQINVIQGKACIAAQLMLTLIERSGHMEDIDIEESQDACVITTRRRGRSPQVISYTRADAVAEGLANKDGWRKRFGVMLYWRAVSKMGRRVYPDVIAGCYTPEEMGADVNDDGQAIEAHVAPQKFPDQGSGHGRTGSYAHDDHDAAFRKMLIECNADLVRDWKQAWMTNDNPFPQGLLEQPVRSYEVIMHLYNEDVAAGRLEAVATTEDENTGEVVPRASIEQLRKMVAITFAKDPKGVRERVERYMHRQAMNVAVDFVNANRGEMIPIEFDPDYNQEPEVQPEVQPEDQSQEPEPLPPPAPAKKMGKKELAEKVKARLEAEAKERASEHGDAYEGPDETIEEALSN